MLAIQKDLSEPCAAGTQGGLQAAARTSTVGVLRHPHRSRLRRHAFHCVSARGASPCFEFLCLYYYYIILFLWLIFCVSKFIVFFVFCSPPPRPWFGGCGGVEGVGANLGELTRGGTNFCNTSPCNMLWRFLKLVSKAVYFHMQQFKLVKIDCWRILPLLADERD